MLARREAITGLALGAFFSAVPSVAWAQQASSLPWQTPSNDTIRELLADRIDRQRRGVGIAVGVIEPTGRRVVTYGASGTRRPLDGDTVFQIGSVTKVFTALLLSDMVSRGEVSLDSPVRSYLTELQMRERGRPVTLRDLATHLSGFPAMPTNFDLHAIPDPISAYSLDNLEAFLATFDPQREPGVAFEYSNLGVALLGRLLGRRAGKEYEELLRERVLIPLGLESTFITPSAEQSARVTPGHDRYLRPVDTWEMRAMPASGSLRSSANDVLTFLSVYFNGLDTPLRQAADFQLAQPRPAVGPSQGLGLMVRRTGTQTTYGFNGSKEGYVAFIGFDPAAAVGVVVLSNNRPDDTLDALGLHILTGRPLAVVDPVPPPRELWQPLSVPRRVLDRYEGTYIEGKTRYVVGCTDRRLLLQTWGDGVDEFFLERDQRFISRTSEDTLQFDASNGGPASSFTIRTGGAERRALRVPRSS